jgi:hypothetical protein
MKLNIPQIPGGNNTSSQNACAQQFSVSQSVFGQNNAGVSKREDCQNLPDILKPGCLWRFDWFKDASFPRYAILSLHSNMVLIVYSANFQRVVCPANITAVSQCSRNDDKILAGNVTASAASISGTSSTAAAFAAILLGVLSI